MSLNGGLSLGHDPEVLQGVLGGVVPGLGGVVDADSEAHGHGVGSHLHEAVVLARF